MSAHESPEAVPDRGSLPPATLFTIGHSTRDLDEFLTLLADHGVGRLADIRRYPGSRRYPHFSSAALAASLEAAGVEYIHIPELGGRRKPDPASPNRFWQNAQFRAYADHMATGEFQRAVDEVLLATQLTTAFMCAEAVPWRCHRNLLSDDLVRRGLEVVHILSPGKQSKHSLNAAAREAGGVLIYPSAQQRFLV